MFRSSSSTPSTATNSGALHEMEINLYTKAAGLIGNILGRDLKIHVENFSVDYNVTSRQPLLVHVPLATLRCECEVDSERRERVPLSFAEMQKVDARVRSALRSHIFPEASFLVTEDSSDRTVGVLTVAGEQSELTCVKVVESPFLMVRCPVSMKKFRVVPHSMFFGAFRVEDEILVEAKVPLKLVGL